MSEDLLVGTGGTRPECRPLPLRGYVDDLAAVVIRDDQAASAVEASEVCVTHEIGGARDRRISSPVVRWGIAW